jgi:hypothetical protein
MRDALTTSTTLEAIMKMDFSPIDLKSLSRQVARNVNQLHAIKDGGNISLAAGRVLYPDEAAARREKVISSVK